MPSDAFTYEGDELDVFTYAQVWKRYWFGQVQRFITGRFLEIGAGTGNNVPLWACSKASDITLLEPDSGLAGKAEIMCAALMNKIPFKVVCGKALELGTMDQFDSIALIDVLEHIPDDRLEVLHIMDCLKPGGYLIVLSPAYAWLYSDFDRRIGHLRRYTRKTLRQSMPPGLIEERLRYLDSVGLLTSLANRMVLKQGLPKRNQILFWDRCLVPASAVLDRVLGYSIGRSVYGVWRRG